MHSWVTGNWTSLTQCGDLALTFKYVARLEFNQIL